LYLRQSLESLKAHKYYAADKQKDRDRRNGVAGRGSSPNSPNCSNANAPSVCPATKNATTVLAPQPLEQCDRQHDPSTPTMGPWTPS
jgi:hypothetical protein